LPSLFLSFGICKMRYDILDPEHCRYVVHTGLTSQVSCSLWCVRFTGAHGSPHCC
jgi:hypothetical protein